METLTVTRTITLDASNERVWRLIADEVELGGWFGAEVQLDVSPGGVGRFAGEDGRVRRAVVDAVDAGHRVRWTWWDESDPADASTVEITLEATAEEATRLTVTETRVVGGARACALAGAEVADAWNQRLDRVQGRFAALVGAGS